MSKLKFVYIIVAVAVVLGIIFSVRNLKKSDSTMVEIIQNSEVLYTFDLSKTENQEFIIESENGSHNTIIISNGEIWISEADCPDKTCVNMGKLKSENLPIICLPNKLIVRYIIEE